LEGLGAGDPDGVAEAAPIATSARSAGPPGSAAIPAVVLLGLVLLGVVRGSDPIAGGCSATTGFLSPRGGKNLGDRHLLLFGHRGV